MYIPVLSYLNESHINQTQLVKDVFSKQLFCKIMSCKITVVVMLKRYLWKNKIKLWLIRTVKHTVDHVQRTSSPLSTSDANQ